MIELRCRDTFGAIAKMQAEAPQLANPYFVISSAVIVGGLLQDGEKKQTEENRLYGDDQHVFLSLVAEMIKAGVRFEDAKIHLCNDRFGDDFIRDTPHADLLFMAWVNKDANEWGDLDSEKLWESPLLKEGHTWEGAIAKSNSRLVAVFDEGLAVSADDIPVARYKEAGILSKEYSEEHSMQLFIRRDLV